MENAINLPMHGKFTKQQFIKMIHCKQYQKQKLQILTK